VEQDVDTALIRINNKICQKLDEVRKLQQEVYFLARERDELKWKKKNLKSET